MTAQEIIRKLYGTCILNGIGHEGTAGGFDELYSEAEAFLKGRHMTFDEYQAHAATTKVYDKRFAATYPALGLNGEAGEVAEKLKKVMRDQNGNMTDAARHEIALELGDVLWYVAALAADLGYKLDAIAEMNVNKLTKRKAEDKLKGTGDDR